jgi:hypothetical protein
MRTMTTRKGRMVVTTLTDEEALLICEGLPSDFARDLGHKGARGLSNDQWTWVHILAMESVAPKPEARSFSIEAILSLFQQAAKSLKHPKVRLESRRECFPVLIGMAGESSRYPGSLNITDGGPFGNNVFYGRIQPDGAWEPRRDCPEEVIELLGEFAADPAGVAARYGRLTGSCCFCGRSLADERSTGVGYGPICAERFGLPWGVQSTEAPVNFESREYWEAQTAKLPAGTNLGRGQ